MYFIGFLSASLIGIFISLFLVIRKQRKEVLNRGYSNEYFSTSGENLEKLNQFRYQYDRERKKDLEHLIKHAKYLIQENSHFDYPKNHPIFYLIRTLTMNVQSENDLNVLKQKGDRIKYKVNRKRDSSFDYTSAYFHFFEYIIRKYRMVNKTSFHIEEPIHVNLAIMPIISRVWRDDRLLDALANIGSDVRQKNNYLVELPKGFELKKMFFKQDNNHLGAYVYPLGFVYVYNGNHSINAGLMKSEGELKIDEIYDLTGMYERYEFDGTYLIDKDKGKSDRIPFNMGALFEIGRVLIDYPDLFPNEVRNGLEKQI